MSSNEKITELKVYDKENDQTIFTEPNVRYMIPLYQRAYAWEELQINQLIEDIRDFDDGDDAIYYLGSVIVSRDESGNEYHNDMVYEVIDGQQRLTTLFLLLNYLELPEHNVDNEPSRHNSKCPLCFECRDISDKTLRFITKKDKAMLDDPDEGLINGAKIIEKTFQAFSDDDKKEFKSRLSKVKLYRIVVPEKTDLNRYFEIMNTRGEQLEQQDILKADLMKYLSDDKSRVFAKIWDACSDMNGYVQMHFDTETRKTLFGDDWSYLDIGAVDRMLSDDGSGNDNKARTISEIIKSDFVPDSNTEVLETGERLRFESIITFPFFLLHVLKVYVAKNNIEPKPPKLLDDRKLKEIFDNVKNNGRKNTSEAVDKAEFAFDFVKYLLKCRYLFDKYIIKREYTNDDKEGKWSLKRLRAYGAYKEKRASYIITSLVKKGNDDRKEDENKKALMLQSCLRVSYTSPKIMHWITNILEFLYNDDFDVRTFIKETEDIARCLVKEYIDNEKKIEDERKRYITGLSTPHIVFNYLDYLLWRDYKNYKNNFVFEFRNSVEHWYPQHPSEGSIEKLDSDKLNYFGNLCLIQRNENSKFSNLSPSAKMSTYPKTVENGSLKLREMAEYISKSGENSARSWADTDCENHGKKMLDILEKDLARFNVDNDNQDEL